ncbi:MAG: hypothetical protein NT069_32690 [Planctomycetota bacterium]|nr:hypothetical protein [Planctomycetota bacterium]
MSPRSSRLVRCLASMLLFSPVCGCFQTSNSKNASVAHDADPNNTEKTVSNPQDENVFTSYNMERLLHHDPSVSLPELKEAIRLHRHTEIEFAWLTSGCPELRAAAMDYLLKFEEPLLEHYRNLLNEIADSRQTRSEEIDAAVQRRHGRTDTPIKANKD